MIDQTRFAQNLKPTAILDWEAPAIRALVAKLRQSYSDDRQLLRTAHRQLTESVRPIYTLNELQPASVTIRQLCGSCSQRMACLEAIARGAGIPTQAHALRVSGRFWYPRFRSVSAFLPREILLVWPQFRLNDEWVDIGEIHAPLTRIAETTEHEFENSGESIFDALDHTPIDFFGKTCGPGCEKSKFDLSKFVLADEGFFATRDEVFEHFGLLRNTLRGRAFEMLFAGRKSV